MALVETPSAANADTYATVAEFDAYVQARGIAAAYDQPTKENALRRAAGYLDNQYRGRWKGYRTEQSQALQWPRIGQGGDSRFRHVDRSTFFVYGIVDVDGFEIPTNEIPAQVKSAQIEAALLVLAGVSMEPRLERGGEIKSISKGLGPLSKSITYKDSAPSVDRFLVIEGLLRGLVNSTPGASTGNVSLVRA